MFDPSRRRLLTRHRADARPRLPWAVEGNAFTDACSRCNRCLEACETRIIVRGDGGFPQVDFRHGECTFCYRCAEACPEPLFRDRSEPAWSLTAHIGEGCLAYRNIECRSCGDVCEPQALRFRLQPGGVALPELARDLCSGCGACVSLCPVSAITMISTQE
ncbi:ferredoxin-type protein NapF [Oceanimonas marisflavi]|uniref:ferredoxin-type protein NapF n=1 Tax=Oceanimonas marisflavi TaxID=2059724 RepID=UPI000D325A63|nr:ferredoxin-type protein NapF [Oceanimonas marisflavi]